MAANSFKKGSGKDEMAKRILESALSTLIAIDTNHNYVLEGSTATNPTLTEAGTKLVASMQSSVRDTAGTIGDAIAGMKKSQVKKSDSIIIYDEGSQSNYRVTFETLAALIVAGAIDGGDVLTTAKLWSHMASNTEYQINISHLRDALADYLTKDKLQGLFRTDGGDAFLSKIFDDEALGVITFLSGLRSNGVAYMMKGLQIGLYQPGITGFGAKIDENGNGEFESLVVRRFLDVPELRYNRVEVLAGDKWRAPGGGVIESVTPDIDPETGNILTTGTISLKLEEGEVGCIAVDDICMGIFHDFNDPSNNDDATTDDGFGNRTFAGFCTSYFRITEVTATTNIDGVNYYNKVFKYALRPIGGRWSRQIHPQNFMNFVVYGNFTNTSRQSSTYETTAYTRMLRAQNTWEFSWNNIGMQFGDCSLLANFDTQEEPNERANEASKYLFYIDGDIFHTGVLRRVDSHGRDIIDYYDQGVWDPNTEYFYKDRVYWNGSMWLLVREDTVDDQGVHHGITGSEPSEDNPNWLAVVYSQSVRSMGHWEATKCPYPVSAIVNLAGILYISNKETSNPPRGLLTGKVNGQTTYLKDKDGKYFLIDEDESNISDDWDVLLDIREMVSGEDAIYINLTNDADSIITDINGNIAPGTEYPTTKAQLYRGSVQITSGITWSVSAAGCSASIAPESGTVVTSNMTADKATVTISATYNNITYQKVFTFSKLFGADKYYLQPSADVIKFNPNSNGGTGEYTPTSLTVRAYVIKGGDKLEITSGAGLGFIRFGGNTYYSGMTVQINNMSVFTSGKLTFELFDSQSTPQLQDMEEVPLVQDGVNGAGSAVVNLTNDTDTVCCDSEGNIDPSDSLPTTNAQLYYDLQKVTTGLTWNCNATGCTATIEEDHDNPGEGKLTVTAMSADVASVLIFCNFRGEQYSKTFTFKKLFGADKYYLQMSGDAIVMDKTGSFRPNSITARAYCKRFGNDPIECNAQDFPHIKIACQTLQQQSGYSPQSVVITDSVFTDRHLVFTLIDDSTPGDVKVLDTEDIPLVLDGTDGIDGKDGKDWHYAGMWDSEAEYKAGDVVRMGDTMYVALVDNTNKPPREILKDCVDGKYLKDENDRYLMTGSDLTDDINWDFYFRDGRDGIDGVDGTDGRDGQDGDTPVFVNLTNDTDSVICDMDGNPLEELPTTIAQFFFGSLQLLHDDGVEWSVSHLVGCTLEGEAGITDDGYVQVKTMSADRAQVTIRATYKSQYYEKNFNFTKLYGTDKYVLAPNFGTVQFNPDNGSYYPTSLVLNAFVVKNGATIDLTQASGLGYIQIGNDTQHKYYNGDSIQTATFFAVSGIEITLRDPDGVVKDKEYIPRISDGRKGNDGADAVTMWFDDSNIHFICDAEGTPASGQTYSTTGKLYNGGNDVALHASLSKAESTTVNCTGVLNVADNTEFILTVTGFKAGATDSNEVKVTLVAADESISREFIIHVDKVRPGADGKSPVVYNVVPNINVVNKDKETGVFTPATLAPSVRKSYVDTNGAVAHQMLSASQALSSEGIHIYYRFDAMIQTVTEAIGNMDDGNPLTLPSSMNSYVNFAIAKSDGIILDNQSVSAVSDGIDGTDGADGNGIASITRTFAISNVSSTPNESTEPQHFGNWTTQSPAVTEAYPHLWAKEVVLFTNTSSTTKYYHIGSRGDNGIDAQDMEFVYIRTKTSTAPVILADNTYTDSKGKAYTSDGHLPHVSGNSNIESDNSGVSGKTYECTDDPKGVNNVWKYEWEIKRSKGAANSNGKRTWNPYSGTMTLHNNFAESLLTMDITNDSDQFGADSESRVLVQQVRSTVVSMMYGTQAQAFLAVPSIALKYDDGTSVPTDVAAVSVSPNTAGQTEYTISVTIKATPSGTSPLASHSGIYVDITGSCSNGGPKTIRFSLEKVMSGAPGVAPVIYQLNPTLKSIQFSRDSSNNLIPSSRRVTVNVLKTIGNTTQEITSAISGITFDWGFDDNAATSGHTGRSIGSYFDVSNSDASSYSQVWIKLSTGDKETIPILKDGAKGTDGRNGTDGKDGADGKDGKSFVSRGHWRSGEEYAVGDMVSFAGSIYRCLVASSNIPPLQCLTDNGNFFLVDKNGNYIVNYPIVANTANWELSIEYQRRIMFDLDNESDTILYDTNGKKISQDVVSHAILYVDGAEYVGAVTYGINASGCTATIQGRTIIVTGVSGTGGTVEATCTYDGNNYTAILSVRKLVGVNKYEIVPSANSVKKDPNSNNQYTPSAGVTFQIFRTDQTGVRRAITAADMNTGDEEGFRIGLIRGGKSEATIAIDYTITPSDFEIGDCRITLYDKNNSVQDSEYIPVIAEGVNGQNTIRVDLDNENDSMLYDGSGNLISGNCTANATLYDGEAPVTSALTWKITVRSGSVITNAVSGTLPGKQLVVSGISSGSATILVYTRYKGYDRGITLTVKKLVGVDKYELSVSPNSVGKDGNTGEYDTDYIAVDVYKTAQNGSRTKLNSLPTGYTLKSIINGVTESISLGSQSISKAKFAGTNIAIELRDNNNSLLDNENVPIVSSGTAGVDSISISATPSSLIINQDITNTDNIKNPNLSEYVYFYLWKGGENITANITSIKVNTNGKIYLATENSQTTGSFTYYHPYLIIRGIAKSGDNYYSSAQIGLTVNFTDNGVAKTISYTLSVYVNLIGTWKITVENGVKQEVGDRIAYEAGPNGTVLRTAWNANITESATALRSEYTEQICKAGEYGANLFGFSKGVVFSDNIIPFIQGYGFAQKSAGQIWINNLGFGGKGGYFTISFYARMSSTSRTVTFKFWAVGMLGVYNPDDATNDPIFFSRGISASTWTKVTQTVYIKSFENDTQRGGQFYVDDAPGDNLLYIRQLKIERGNEETAFTPAAEDLALVGNGQLITSLDNAGMATDGRIINGRKADYYVEVNPSGFPTYCIDYLYKNNAFNITAGKMYTLSFWAKCSSYGMIITTHLYKSGEPIISDSSVIYDPGTNGSQMEKLRSDGESKVRLSTAWKQYFIHLYATNNITGANLIALRVVKAENANVTGTIYMSDIRFVEGFETTEGQYRSLIEQSARRVSMSVEHDLLQTGIDITHQKITLRADQVVFASSNGVSGKIWIDATYGTLHAVDGHFSGIIEANGGTIGGFKIGNTYIGEAEEVGGSWEGTRLYNDGRLILGKTNDDYHIALRVYGGVEMGGKENENIVLFTPSNIGNGKTLENTEAITLNGCLRLPYINNRLPSNVGNIYNGVVYYDDFGYLRLYNINNQNKKGVSPFGTYLISGESEVVLPLASNIAGNPRLNTIWVKGNGDTIVRTSVLSNQKIMNSHDNGYWENNQSNIGGESHIFVFNGTDWIDFFCSFT